MGIAYLSHHNNLTNMFQNVLLTKVVSFDTIDTRQSVFKHTFKNAKMGKAHTPIIFENKVIF